MPVTHLSSAALEEAFWSFWAGTFVSGEGGPGPDPDLAVIAHIGSPVETGLFRRCVERDGARLFHGPYPLHELGTLLLALGEPPHSVDAYVGKYSLAVPFRGAPHHPLYDDAAVAIAWEHAMRRLRAVPGEGNERNPDVRSRQSDAALP